MTTRMVLLAGLMAAICGWNGCSESSDSTTRADTAPIAAEPEQPPVEELVDKANADAPPTSDGVDREDEGRVPISETSEMVSVTDLAPQTDVITPAIAADPLPGGVRILVPEQEFKTEGPDGALRVNYDDLDLLKVINMYPVTPDVKDHMPDWLLNLDGKKIRLRGFMKPAFEATDIRAFVLARDTGACCFGPNPRIYYLIDVFMKKGTTTDYIEGRPFDVVGTLNIEPEAVKGEMYQLYQIKDAMVISK